MTACGRGAKTEPLIFIVKVEDMWKRIQERILRVSFQIRHGAGHFKLVENHRLF